jgi:hypothetical protein
MGSFIRHFSCIFDTRSNAAPMMVMMIDAKIAKAPSQMFSVVAHLFWPRL